MAIELTDNTVLNWDWGAFSPSAFDFSQIDDPTPPVEFDATPADENGENGPLFPVSDASQRLIAVLERRVLDLESQVQIHDSRLGRIHQWVSEMEVWTKYMCEAVRNTAALVQGRHWP